jgi:hypothetical protein
MYRPPHDVHVPLVQRHSARPRGTMLQDTRPQVTRPHGDRAGVVQVVVNMTLNPMAVALVFSPTALVDHVFPHVVPAFLKRDMAYLVFFLTLFQGK